MRSKEVDKSIKSLENFVNQKYYNGVTAEEMKTVLAYIEQLEKMIPTPSNEVPVEYQTSIYVDKRDAVMKSEIRDKIKELEEEQDKEKYVTDIFFIKAGKIEVLKSIIGE